MRWNDAIAQVNKQVALPQGYRLDWGGEYTEYNRLQPGSLSVILPLTIFLVFMLLFLLYNNFKFPLITVAGVLLSAPVGAPWPSSSPVHPFRCRRGWAFSLYSASRC